MKRLFFLPIVLSALISCNDEPKADPAEGRKVFYKVRNTQTLVSDPTIQIFKLDSLYDIGDKVLINKNIYEVIDREPSHKHVCSDPTHNRCDGECVCDGMECSVDPREYQIELHQDGSATIYDGGRTVGTLDFDSTQTFHQVMLRDNL